MKKLALIVAVLLVLLTLIGIGVMFKFNQDYGFSLAGTVSHETRATEDTRVRAVLNVDKVRGYLERMLPPDDQLPAIMKFLPWKATDILPGVLPREIAILVSPEKESADIGVTLFVNERRGGPQLCKVINESDLFGEAVPIQWTPEKMTLRQRGILEANGVLPLPQGVAEFVRKTWPQRAVQDAPIRIDGENFLEIVFDNRDGDLITLAAAIVFANGDDWNYAIKDQMPEGMLATLASITDLKLTANPASLDKMNVNLRLNARDNSPSGLTFIFNGVVVPEIARQLDLQGLHFEGETEWDEKENAMIGKFRITGIEAYLQAYIPKNLA